MWLGRAHSKGAARQSVNLLGFALMVNGLALHRHSAKAAEPPGGEAAAWIPVFAGMTAVKALNRLVNWPF